MADLRTIRFRKDLKDFFDPHCPDFIVVTNFDDRSSRFLEVSVSGPPETPYESGTFEVLIKLETDFPFSTPKANFQTPVWHPNVGATGRICMDLLSNWKSGTRLIQVAEACRALLGMPNNDSPLNADAATMAERVFRDTALAWTSVFARGSIPKPDHLTVKIVQLMSAANIDEETALRRLSRADWRIDDALPRQLH